MVARTIYQFYAELCDYSPKIWRRFQTTDNTSMAKLGYITMTMFEMQACHLFRIDIPYRDNLTNGFSKHAQLNHCHYDFDIKSLFETECKNWRVEVIDEYSFENYDPTDTTKEKVVDAATTTLKQVALFPGSLMGLTYDYGDNWQIRLELAEIIEKSELPAKELPRVLEGEGFGIIEDCGGTAGLAEIAAACKNKKSKRYREICDWYSLKQLDLNSFDITDMNFRLKKVPRIYADIYERKLEPTKRSVDILTRRYLK